MVKFFKTSKNDLINIDAIQMIRVIKGEDLFKKETYGYKLSWAGEALFNWEKIYDKHDPKIQNEFGLGPLPGNPECISVKTLTEKIKNMVVAYCIHLGAPCGGINNSHEMIYILPDDYKKLVEKLEIF